MPTENVSTDRLTKAIQTAGAAASELMAGTHAAREQAITTSRQIIRFSANSIRATHRAEYDEARRLIAEAADLRARLEPHRDVHPEVYFGGYVEDALKEFVEARATLAIAEGSHLPTMEELDVGAAVYMNGLAETIGELRRIVLDLLRNDDFTRCEILLGIMDEIYAALVTLDYPDGVTRGLRRTTDVMRGVLERTRGDVTVALRQRRLEAQLVELNRNLSP